ncbi:hypothetical protein D3C80_695890 [compost metagenome]
MPFANAIVKRHFAQLKTGLAPVRIDQPLFVGQRNVVAEHFLIGFYHLFGDFLAVNVIRRQANQLFFTFAGQQLHRPVTAGEFFVFVTVIHQIR